MNEKIPSIEEPQLNKLIEVQTQAYKLDSAQELAIFACNSPHQLHGYFQAISWQRNKFNNIEIIAVSGVSIVEKNAPIVRFLIGCLLYTSPSPRDQRGSRMPSSA